METRIMTNARDGFGLRSLGLFLAITFGLAWGIIALFILLPGPMTGLFGQLTGDHPLFYLAVWSPALAAAGLVARDGGVAGLRRFASRARLWRCPPAWGAFLVLGVPAVFYAGAALKGTWPDRPLPFDGVPQALTVLALAAIKGPVEEFGWRGFALPLLQRRLAPAWASLIIGLVWGFWHLPAFLLSGTQQSAWSFGPFLAGTVAISVIATALYNASRGSILLAAALHFQLMNPIWPDAQPWDTVLLLGIAGLVLWRERGMMFAGGGQVADERRRGALGSLAG